jgi:hypothetical protein
MQPWDKYASTTKNGWPEPRLDVVQAAHDNFFSAANDGLYVPELATVLNRNSPLPGHKWDSTGVIAYYLLRDSGVSILNAMPVLSMFNAADYYNPARMLGTDENGAALLPPGINYASAHVYAMDIFTSVTGKEFGGGASWTTKIGLNNIISNEDFVIGSLSVIALVTGGVAAGVIGGEGAAAGAGAGAAAGAGETASYGVLASDAAVTAGEATSYGVLASDVAVTGAGAGSAGSMLGGVGGQLLDAGAGSGASSGVVSSLLSAGGDAAKGAISTGTDIGKGLVTTAVTSGVNSLFPAQSPATSGIASTPGFFSQYSTYIIIGIAAVIAFVLIKRGKK